jgi:hypothetical protein
MSSPPAPIGARVFTDGLTRLVYEEDQGQYVMDDGERVYGLWLVSEDDFPDLPIIVQGHEPEQ